MYVPLLSKNTIIRYADFGFFSKIMNDIDKNTKIKENFPRS